MKQLGTAGLYLHCEECEHGWRNPEAAVGLQGMFLTLDEEVDAAPATIDEIRTAGWAHYVAGRWERH